MDPRPGIAGGSDSCQIATLHRVNHHHVVPPFFWSPDSRFIGFQSGGKLAKIAISGGPAQTLCDVKGTVVGGSWNRDGVIVFADTSRGLMQVSASGGVASPLTTIDPSRQEVVHVLPSFLPDGRHFLYLRASSTPENTGVYVGSLNTKPEEQDSRRLLATTSGPVYVPSSDSDSGQVLFLRRGTLMAQRFNPDRLEFSGEAVQVAAQVGSFLDYGFFSASNNGVLVYRSAVGEDYQLKWLDRQGKLLGTVAEPGGYNSMALSPDGRRVAVSRTNPENTPNWDVWLLDVERNTSTRLTYEQVRATFPVWSADGSSVIFGSAHGNDEVDLYLKLASGAGDERLLLKSTAGDKYATSSSQDGRFLLYTAEDPETKSDLWVLPLQGDRKPIPFLRTRFNESSGQFSPDGRWIAYTSDESGSDEILRPGVLLRLCSRILGCRGQVADLQGGWNRSQMARGWQRVVLCGFRREAHVSRHQRQADIQGRSAQAAVPITAWFYRRRCHSRRQTFPHRRACGAKRFRTLYGGAELADDLEEIGTAICRQIFPAEMERRSSLPAIHTAARSLDLTREPVSSSPSSAASQSRLVG